MLAALSFAGGKLAGCGLTSTDMHSRSCLGFHQCNILQPRRGGTVVTNAQQQTRNLASASAAEPSLADPENEASKSDDYRGFNERGKMTLAHPTYKRIQEWWHPTKNHGDRPEDYTHRSGKTIWLQCHGCPRCGEVHEWNPKVADSTKTNGNNVCPACESKGGHFCQCRSVATNPILKREWHDDNPMPPTAVSLGHQQKVKWRCRNCAHEWTARPAFRSNDGTGCPECGKTCRTRHGSIALVRPDLMEEWDWEKNTQNPEEVTCGSGCGIWWRCQTCNHSWNSLVKARALNGANCPKCSQDTRFQARQFARDSPAYFPQLKERDKTDASAAK